MNAETTTFVVGFEEAPGSNAAKSSKKHNKHQNGKKGNEPTHLHLIDSANPDNNVRFTISQLWSYAEKMPAAFQRFQGVGYKGSPRRVINNLKKAKSFFTGESPVKSFPKKGVNPRVYEEVRVEVISSEEFDALFEEFDAEVSTEVDHDKYEDDTERDARQLELGIALFRNLLNSEERVKNLMKLFEGVMYGGANKKESLWTVYLGFMKFILCGVAEDYKGKTRNDDGSFDLDHPHLSFTALANAINEAKVNLTAKNTIATEEPFHQRSPSTSSRKGSFHSQRRPSFHFHRSNSFNGAVPKQSPHDFASSLKWCLVIGLIEKTFTPALYEKLKATSGKPYVYSAHDIGTIIAPFNIEPLGEVPAKPESKKEKAAKAAAAAKTAAKESSDEEDEAEEAAGEAAEKPDEEEADEKDDDEAVEDSDEEESDDEEEEEEKPEPAEEAAEAEEAEEDDDDDDDDDEKDEKDEESEDEE